MKNFTVVFIPNHRLNEDDSSDFKEWKTIPAKDSQAACDEVSGYGLVVRCTED